MKNKISIIILVNTFIMSSLITNCNGVRSVQEPELNNEKQSISIQEKAAACLCPRCQGGSRFLYKVSNSSNSNNLILLCEECESAWITPNEIESDQAVGDKDLANNFGVKNTKILFDKVSSDWAKTSEVNKDWAVITNNNKIFIK